MTIDQAQTAIHSLYAGDTNTPTSSDSEYTVRLELIKAAINAWESETGILWNEMFTTLADAADGTKTVAASTLAYDAPTDFKFLAGYVETISASDSTQRTKWRVIKPEEASVHQGGSIIGLDAGYAYVTGNDSDGYKINFSSQPTAGGTIDYPYYKNATTPTTGSDVIEMSDPYFCVYFVLSKLHEQDGEGDRATFAMSQAESKLSSMKTSNAMAPHYQLNQAQDSTILRTNNGLGV